MLVDLSVGIGKHRAAAEVVGVEVEDRLLFEGVVPFATATGSATAITTTGRRISTAATGRRFSSGGYDVALRRYFIAETVETAVDALLLPLTPKFIYLSKNKKEAV